MKKLLKLGAEAKLIRKDGRVVKKRIKKGYRLSQIDLKLRKERTRSESSLLRKAIRAKVNVPRIFKVDKEKAVIEMEFISGKRIDSVLSEKLSRQLGREIAELHSAGIIHGDLTTSNILVKENKIYFIDFGLGEFSKSVEKRAVDLRVLKEAVRANHPEKADKFNEGILKSYEENMKDGAEILKRLEKVESRGRYKKK
ncbi:MAG: KEOPS complex kinase/ATPase Bud32 [Candidatus Undinarchaeales archaeon]